MAERRIDDIRGAIQQRRFPTITLWNRLEGRPRADDFERALQAEIRDPLWMLCKQWQMGEFEGDDAGSPVFAMIHVASSQLDGYQPAAGAARPFEQSLPLEAQVERRSLPFERGDQPLALDLRLLMGRHWLKLLRALGDFRAEFVGLYGVDVPDPTLKSAAEVCAHADVWQQTAAVAQRSMDGYKLYRYLKANVAHHAYDGTSIPAGQHADVDLLAEKFVRWFEALVCQPEAPTDTAWRPPYLEYQFAVSSGGAPAGAVLTAEGYHGGQLDWFSLDVDHDGEAPAVGPGLPAPLDLPPPTQSFIPTAITFDGMPHTRWWTFEDTRTNFGKVHPGTTDLATLMLIEFGLVYANDWFLFPLTLPVGTLTGIKGLAVTDVFGERTWIEAAGRGPDEAWQRWSMYTLAVAGNAPVAADTRLLLLPTVPKVQQGKPLEEIMLLRDEMANMVWGIETRVALPDGRSTGGYEAATDLRRFYERLVSATSTPPPAPAAPLRYEVMSNNVPENWIPFIPVRVPGDNREIQLQRAALPRIIPRDPAPISKIRPRTDLLRAGLDQGHAYFLHEEEVSRSGARVMQAYQRTRWYGGRVVVWLGAQKQTGRGEGSSALRFDQLVLPKAGTGSA